VTVLIDSSAWIEYLRDRRQDVADRVEVLLDGQAAALTEAVTMEVLQGGRSSRHTRDLQRLLSRASLLRVESHDFAEAAFLWRLCRANGETVRSSVDCLIAAVAIRTDTPVLAADRDFEALARHTPLQLLTA
jgi:predicted nucleic acid-binding protein